MNPLKYNFGKRRQFFEIQDFVWCPKAVRDGVTDLLVINLKLVRLYEPAIPVLSNLARLTHGKWVDLCAGAGGGSIPLKQKLPGEIKELVLTDLYPHSELNLPEGVSYYPESVDAMNVPKKLTGMRTLFTSFHHLPDEVAVKVLKDARDSKTPIAVFEFTDRSLFCLLMVAPTLIFSFFLVPLVWPWKFSRFFFTYIIPLIPIVAFIDIVMSCLRTRTPDELNEMIDPLRADDYIWETGKIPTYLGLTLTYLTGRPR